MPENNLPSLFCYIIPMKKLFVLSLLGMLVFVGATSLSANAAQNTPQDYIVVFKNGVDPVSVANEIALTHGLSLNHVYSTALKGFSATIPSTRLAKLQSDPRIKFISEDKKVQIGLVYRKRAQVTIKIYMYMNVTTMKL